MLTHLRRAVARLHAFVRPAAAERAMQAELDAHLGWRRSQAAR